MADDKTLDTLLDSSEPISPEIEQAIDQEFEAELQKEVAFGDRPTEAAALEAVSSATFGLSDQALVKSGLYTPEELREVRERSPIASTAGMIAGIAGPALATGGTSALAKGVATIGAPVAAAAKVGVAAEKAAAKALQALIKDTGRKKLAQEVIKKGIAGAAEGAAFGIGEAIKEDALGKAELNAENIISSMGTGALLGAGAGGAFGAAKASVPVVARGLSPITQRVKSSFSKLADPVEAAAELTGFTAKELRRIEKSNPNLLKELPDFYRSKLGLQTLDDVSLLADRADNFRAETGQKIGSLVKEIDSLSQAEPTLLPTKAEVYSKISKELDDNFIIKYKDTPGFKDQIKPVKQLKKDFDQLAQSADRVSVAELQNLRQKMDELAFKTRSDLVTYKAQAAKSARSVLRNEIDNIADRVSATTANDTQRNLLRELKQANKDFSTASEVLEPLARKARKSSFVSFPDVVETAAGYAIGQEAGLAALGLRRFVRSDLRRNLAILADMQKQANAVQSRISEATADFFTASKKVIKPVSLKVLLNSPLSKDFDKPKEEPKTKAAAFKQISDNIAKFQADPNFMVDRLVKATSRVESAAPNTAQEMRQRLVAAINFLEAKLPKAKNTTSSFLFKKPYQPSTLELAKFERYLQTIEAPLSVLDDLEAGNLTREHVEALQAVYPNLFVAIRDSVLDQLAKQDKLLDYNKRVQLGILLGTQTDESLKPENIQFLQSSFGKQEEAPQQGAVKPTVAGVSNVNFANRALTGPQATVARREIE